MKRDYVKVLAVTVFVIGFLSLLVISWLSVFGHKMTNRPEKQPYVSIDEVVMPSVKEPMPILVPSNLTNLSSDSPTNASSQIFQISNNVIPIRIELVWIPPGTFTMGSPEAEQDRRNNEGPQTVVAISRGYWLGKYDVTIDQFRSVVGVLPDLHGMPYATDSDRNPIVALEWKSATNFCYLLTEKEQKAGRLPTGYIYRLPTEAEWEFACRAGTKTRFSYGDDPSYDLLDSYAWYGANSGGKIHAVGMKLPNSWGLYDMHGNVFEWCLDEYNYYPGGSVSNPIGVGGYRITRGGAYNVGGKACRSAYRGIVPSGPRISNVGFRVALAADLQ